MCRQSSAAVMPCGSNCTHWRCRWLPLPSHLLLPLLSLFYFSIAASSGVCVCAGGEGEGDACFTQPHHRPLATNSRLVAKGEEGVSLCVWLHLLSPLPSPCCAVLFVGATMPHGAHTQPPPPPRVSWHRGLTASPLLSPLCDSTQQQQQRQGTHGQTGIHT